MNVAGCDFKNRTSPSNNSQRLASKPRLSCQMQCAQYEPKQTSLVIHGDLASVSSAACFGASRHWQAGVAAAVSTLLPVGRRMIAIDGVCCATLETGWRFDL